jgi:hypothetical protein
MTFDVIPYEMLLDFSVSQKNIYKKTSNFNKIGPAYWVYDIPELQISIVIIFINRG